MNDILKEAVLITAKKSVPLNEQAIDIFGDSPTSDQYIVDGPTFRDLLKLIDTKYESVVRDKDWQASFKDGKIIE